MISRYHELNYELNKIAEQSVSAESRSFVRCKERNILKILKKANSTSRLEPCFPSLYLWEQYTR